MCRYIDDVIAYLYNNNDNSNSNLYFYFKDNHYSIQGITDINENIIESYSYSAFGILSIYDENHDVILNSKFNNTITYTGRRYDNESNLYYYRNRMYNSELARFISKDPKGYVDGMNLYSYVKNNPLKYLDPMGTTAQESWSSSDLSDFNDDSYFDDVVEQEIAFTESGGAIGDNSIIGGSSLSRGSTFNSNSFGKSFADGLRRGTIPTGAISRANIPGLSQIAIFVTLGTHVIADIIDPITVKDVISGEFANQATEKLIPGGQTKDLVIDILKDVYSNNKQEINNNINNTIEYIDKKTDEIIEKADKHGVFDLNHWENNI